MKPNTYHRHFSPCRSLPHALVVAALCLRAAPGLTSDLDTVGVTLLRQLDPTLNGSTVRVAQPEAPVSANAFEVNPSVAGLPVSTFSYFSTSGSATTFPNAVGTESFHANGVGQLYYGPAQGVATNVAHVDNYEANYFVSSVIFVNAAISARIVNQSFVSATSQQTFDTSYDNYAARFNTLFISGAGDSGPVLPPSTSYDGLGVGAFGGSSAVGPTTDNGRAKPDLTAPASATSFSTPLVAGSAAVLLQAASRGDGGSDTNSAADIRTLKALLLNGAIKPADWTHPSPSPLDTRYGAGVLNLFNSYRQLVGGKHAFIASTSVTTGSAHPPTGATGNVSTLSGWDFNSVSSGVPTDGVNHYYFNLPNSPNNGAYTATLTLVWLRQNGQNSINNLDLFLYNVTTGALIQSSLSTVDNVEHIYLNNLPPGRYDVQVLKHGGLGALSISAAESYALAFEFFQETLSVTRSNRNVTLAWPVYPAGFRLQACSSLLSPQNWTTVGTAPTVVGNQNQVTLIQPASNQYYRLIRP